MNKLIIFLKKNNCLAVKIGASAAMACIVLMVAVFLLLSKDEPEKGIGKSNYTETTMELVEKSTKESKEVETTKNLENESITQPETIMPLINVEPETTTQQETTTQPETTAQQETTTQPITTEPETTTEEETTEQLRGMDGVILEELAFYYNSGECDKIPMTWKELSGCDGETSSVWGWVAFYGDSMDVSRSILGNEILFFDENDNNGSTYNDVIAVYGEPIEMVSFEGNTVMYYKYCNLDIPKEQVLYVIFHFGNEQYCNKLCAIEITNEENLNSMLDYAR